MPGNPSIYTNIRCQSTQRRQHKTHVSAPLISQHPQPIEPIHPNPQNGTPNPHNQQKPHAPEILPIPRIPPRLPPPPQQHTPLWLLRHPDMEPLPHRPQPAQNLQRLALPAGSQVLDAGCGAGHVALYMAREGGLRVTAIDVVQHHVDKARQNVKRAGLTLNQGQVTAQRMDYHHLAPIPPSSHEGVYTMETLVHATDPESVLQNFKRILRPGGRLVLFEYEHDYDPADADAGLVRSLAQVNRYAAMPTMERSRAGFFKRIVEEAGFVDVEVRDYSRNIWPMLRLFAVLALVPFWLVSFFGIEAWFPNTVAGARAYVGREYWSYVTVSATKPGGLEVGKDR